MLQAIADYLYPVGSYYTTESPELDTVEKMNAYFGGTWEAIIDKFIYAFSVAGQEGGEASHTLTIEEMPNHNHRVLTKTSGYSGNATNLRNGSSGYGYGTAVAGLEQNASTAYVNDNGTDWYLQGTGGSQPHNNMPPYRTAFVYKRTSLSGGGLKFLQLWEGGEDMLNSPQNPELQSLLDRLSNLENETSTLRTNLTDTQNSLTSLTTTVNNMLKTTGVKIGEFLGSTGTIRLSEPITNFRIIVINSDNRDDGNGFVTSQQCLPVGYILACGYGKELSSYGRDNVSFTEKFVNANTLQFTQDYYSRRKRVYGIR